MKKVFRCHVCNDIHFGIKPPETCPTCMAKNAYVEVSSAEAQKIIGYSPRQLDEESFLKAVDLFVQANQFHVNPDKEKVGLLVKGIFENEKNHGLKYCPCRLCSKDFKEDLNLICPCNFLVHETYKGKKDGECWCGLFVRRK